MKKSGAFVLVLLKIFILNTVAQKAIAQDIEWFKHFSGMHYKDVVDIATDGSDHIYIVGVFEGTLDFNPGVEVAELSSAGNTDVFLAKYSPFGDWMWSYRIGGVGSDVAKGIAIDAAGNIILAGSFTGAVDFDPGSSVYTMSAAGLRNSFVIKLDQNAEFLWGARLANGFNEAYAMDADAAGNVVLTGGFTGTVDFDPGSGVFNLSSSSFSQVAYILQLDENGTFVFAKTINGSNDVMSSDIAIDEFGNIVCVGNFYGTADLDPGVGLFVVNAGGTTVFGCFVLKLDTNGLFLWGRFLHSMFDVLAQRLSFDEQGNVLCTGLFYFEVNFDEGFSNVSLSADESGSRNVYVLKLNTVGQFLWVKAITGFSEVIAMAIETEEGGSFFLTGLFSFESDFDTGSDEYIIDSSSGFDFFIARFFPDGNLDWVKSFGGTLPSVHAFGSTLCVRTSGNILVAGGFSGTVDMSGFSGLSFLSSQNSVQQDLFLLNFTNCAPISDSLTFSLCQGDSVSVLDKSFSESGEYGILFNSYESCDSLWIVRVNGAPVYSYSQNVTLCQGESYTQGTEVYKTEGLYEYLYTSVNGCDSLWSTYIFIDSLSIALNIMSDHLYVESADNYSHFQWLECSGNSVSIPGETSPTFYPETDGIYAVVGFNGLCSDTSDCVFFSGANIVDYVTTSKWSLIPNPSVNQVFIALEEGFYADTFEIHTPTGQIVQKGILKSRSLMVSLENLETGVYYVVLYSGKEKSSVKRLLKTS